LERIWRTYSPSTQRAYRADFDLFLRAVFGRSPRKGEYIVMIQAVTSEHVATWLDGMEGKCALTSRARRLAAVRSVLGACVEANVIQRNPAQGRRFLIAIPKRNPLRKAPSTTALFATLAHLKGVAAAELPRLGALRRYGLLYFLSYCGARASDALAITPEVWASARELLNGARQAVIIRKGNQEQPVVVPPKVAKVLDTLALAAAPKASLFGLKRTASIWKAVRSAFKAAGQAPTHPHALRHWYTTEALNGGASVEEVRRQLGHASERTTRIYDDALRASTAWQALPEAE
jgi:integrase